jgi:hypothetical protein
MLPRVNTRAPRAFGSYGGSSAPAWSPLDGSNIGLWLSPATQVQSGGTLTNWLDASPNTIDFAQGTVTNQPTQVTVNARNAASFDGTNDQLVSASALSTAVATTAWHLFAVVDPAVIVGTSPAIYTDDPIICDASAYWGIHLRDSGASTYQVHAYQYDGAQKTASATMAATPLMRIEAWYDGTNVNLIANGVTATPVASGAIAVSTGVLQMGKGSSGANFLNGIVCELFTYKSAQSAGTQTSANAYLTARWGV